MKKAAFVSTNGNDLIMLAGGSYINVTSEFLQSFVNEQNNFEDWQGRDYWTDYANTFNIALKGQNVIAYYENDKLVIVDEEQWLERLEFYDVKPKNWLETLCKEYNTTRYRISKDTGISEQTLSTIVNKNIQIENIKLDTAYYVIIEYFGLDLGEVYERFAKEENKNK
jgi:hypothetical protein